MKTQGSHPVSNLIKHVTLCNMKQAQPVWRTRSYNFKREAWEGNVFFFQVLFKAFFLIIWLELSLFDLWLFRSFYLHRSSAENLVERTLPCIKPPNSLGIFLLYLYKGRSPFNCRLYDFSPFRLLFIAKYLFTGSFKNRSIDI
jgi:hypothetical protein